jgi:hypothetical protein
MTDKPPPADPLPGAIKDRKPAGVEGQSPLDRLASRKRPTQTPKAKDEKAEPA